MLAQTVGPDFKIDTIDNAMVVLIPSQMSINDKRLGIMGKDTRNLLMDKCFPKPHLNSHRKWDIWECRNFS